jgi:hypothetical protein
MRGLATEEFKTEPKDEKPSNSLEQEEQKCAPTQAFKPRSSVGLFAVGCV